MLAFWATLVLALLVSCAASVPRGCTKGKAYVTAMKSDLRNMMIVQEAFRLEHARFATEPDLRSGALPFTRSTGVNLTLERSDANGWSARTTHTALHETVCTISSRDGEPRCESLKDPWRPRFTGSAALNVAIDCWLFAFSLARRQRRLERI